jgi:ribA/ribD-fused uncharacterized protein
MIVVNLQERPYIVHNEKEIKGFFGPYRFLSNFHQCPVYFDGVMYPSTENAFMAAKTVDPLQREQFRYIEPKEAKAIGRKINLRPDWEEVKYDVMLAVCFDKFYRNKSIRQKLIDTKEAYLEETNHWGDQIWGANEYGEVKNSLGQILMHIRDVFRRQLIVGKSKLPR